ncbi:MAG: methionine--tRNA ligase [Clostridia bacterium]|nr:methionine--tRNA ligase [Clostridia bacterium]
MEKKKFYLTTAIAYTSRKPHIGNTYEVVLSDAIARFKRFEGYDVFFLTGTDEHGQKIEQLANDAGISPQEYVDGVAGEIRSIWDLMNSSYDKFIRTTDDYHVDSVQKIFKKLYDQGDIYKDSYTGWYCTPCESFWTDTQLADGKCPDCGREVHKGNEDAYFFKMSKYQKALEKHIEENPDFIQPESRKKEMVNNFIKPGIQDLCVSRTSIKWGIPVTFDDKHTIYVWLDALTNYINALGYTPESKGELYNKYWPADVHIIGKDILRFHTIYWPIFLMALGEPLPKKVFGHPWLLSGEDKMSKSLGNVIYADDLVRHFGTDAIRYYLLREMPYAQDGTITYEKIVSTYNTDLANVLGNLANRTVAMVNKYFDGIVPNKDAATDFDEDLKATAEKAKADVVALMDEFRTADALEALWTIANRANKYIDETMPWALAKDEAQVGTLRTVMYNLVEALRWIGSLLEPFMPETAEKLICALGAKAYTLDELVTFGSVDAGFKVGDAAMLFARIDAEKKLAEIEEENAANKAPAIEIEPFKADIEFEKFLDLDIRVGKVLECEPVPKSSKLLRFTIETGSETRQILSGVAKFCKPDEMIGRNVLFVANFPPRKMMGLESNGMILSAEYKDTLNVITVDEKIQSGAQIV